MVTKVHENYVFDKSDPVSFGSVVHNKETFVQFPIKSNGSNTRDFVTVYQRIQNLKISKMLEESDFSSNAVVQKTMKSLNCCRSISLIGNNGNNEKVIKRTSKRCRNHLCGSCGKVRANLMRHRLISYFNSDDGGLWLSDKKAYFITLTLKHNDKTRNYVYLDELKGYVRKLVLSKVFKKIFPFSKKDGGSGWFINYEMTQGVNGLHIHSHILIVSSPIVGRVSNIQKELQDKWLKLTKDSLGLRLDLAGKKNKKSSCNSCKTVGLISEVLEIFKYSVKGSTKLKNNQKAKNDLASWVIGTKGKNLITAGGHFRGLGITSSRTLVSDLPKDFFDGNSSKDFNKDCSSIAMGRTSGIRFNISSSRYYSDKYLKNQINDVFITSFSSDFIPFYGISEDVDFILKLGFSDDDVIKGLRSWVGDVNVLIEESEGVCMEYIDVERQMELFTIQANSFSFSDYMIDN